LWIGLDDMFENIDWNELLKTLINSIFGGIGSGIGLYFTAKALINNFEKVMKKAKKHVQAKKHKM
jgi:hypothetical protein